MRETEAEWGFLSDDLVELDALYYKYILLKGPRESNCRHVRYKFEKKTRNSFRRPPPSTLVSLFRTNNGKVTK